MNAEGNFSVEKVVVDVLMSKKDRASVPDHDGSRVLRFRTSGGLEDEDDDDEEEGNYLVG